VDLFTDFLLATGDADVGGANGINNLLSRKGYMLQLMLRGRDGFESCQGGNKIRGDVLIRDVSTYRTYKPGQKQTWSNPQVLDNWEIDWRFSLDHMAWNDQEIELNASPDLQSEYRYQQFVNMRRKINMRTVTSMAHGMEDEFWALPSKADMEDSAGKEINSLALFSNELQNAAGTLNGLYSSYRASKEVQGINKETFSAWDNARAEYKNIGVTSGSAPHLFDAFDDIILETGIKQVPGPEGAEMSDAPSVHNVCVTGKRGFTNFQRSLRVNQDWFRMGSQNPAYPGPTFNGIQLLYVQALDTAPIYPTAANAAYGTETTYSTFDDATNNSALDIGAGTDSANNDGPRYHFLDFDWLHKVMHSRRYFRKLPMKSPSNQATDHVIPCDTWHNNMCRDFRRQGIVYPTATI